MKPGGPSLKEAWRRAAGPRCSQIRGGEPTPTGIESAPATPRAHAEPEPFPGLPDNPVWSWKEPAGRILRLLARTSQRHRLFSSRSELSHSLSVQIPPPRVTRGRRPHGGRGPGGPEEGGSGAQSPEEGRASVVTLSRRRPNLALRLCASVASPGFRFCVFPSLSPYLFFYFLEEVQISGVAGGPRQPVSGYPPDPVPCEACAVLLCTLVLGSPGVQGPLDSVQAVNPFDMLL